MSDQIPTLKPCLMKKASLHEHGFQWLSIDFEVGLLKNALDELKTSGVTCRALDTFGAPGDVNPRRQINDLKRIACENPNLLGATRKVLLTLEESFNSLGITNADNGRITDMWRLIGSESPVDRQQDHCDWNPRRLSLRDDDSVPLVVIFAFSDDCFIDVSPFTHRGHFSSYAASRIRLKIPHGSCVIFRGDLVHSGSPYDSESWRLHGDILTKLERKNRHICAMPLDLSVNNNFIHSFEDALRTRTDCFLQFSCKNITFEEPFVWTHKSGRPMRMNKTYARINFESAIY